MAYVVTYILCCHLSPCLETTVKGSGGQPVTTLTTNQFTQPSLKPLRHNTGASLIALMMEAARTSEMLEDFYQTTRHYNPEDNHLHTHCRKNLKSYKEH
jgi:hypothetical protein